MQVTWLQIKLLAKFFNYKKILYYRIWYSDAGKISSLTAFSKPPPRAQGKLIKGQMEYDWIQISHFFLGDGCQKQPLRQFFKISVLFFQEQPFYNFPGGYICPLNRHVFFQKGLSICQRDMFFPGESIILCSSNRHKFSRRVCRTDNDLIISSNRYQFSRIAGASIFSSKKYSFFRKPYLIFEHILFSRRPLCLEQIGIFQEGTLRQTDISLIGLDGCFRVGLSFSDWAVRHFTSIWGFFLDREIPDLGLKPRFFSRQTSMGKWFPLHFLKNLDRGNNFKLFFFIIPRSGSYIYHIYLNTNNKGLQTYCLCCHHDLNLHLCHRYHHWPLSVCCWHLWLEIKWGFRYMC